MSEDSSDKNAATEKMLNLLDILISQNENTNNDFIESYGDDNILFVKKKDKNVTHFSENVFDRTKKKENFIKRSRKNHTPQKINNKKYHIIVKFISCLIFIIDLLNRIIHKIYVGFTNYNFNTESSDDHIYANIDDNINDEIF